ncbi:MAG: magnesium-translocating P-type ATPase [Tepidisphaeraceae bacterium]
MTVLGKSHFAILRAAARSGEASAQVREAARQPADAVIRSLGSTATGLSSAEASRRLAQMGPNRIATRVHRGPAWRLFRAARNPLVVLLLLLATVSFMTGDVRAGGVMLVMVLIGVMLRFVQESRADAAAARLQAMIHVSATVLRDGTPAEVPLQDLVPGDIVELTAGDMVPADVRVIRSKDLFIIQSSLTGEAFPIEKGHAPVEPGNQSPLELPNLCFLGTSVERGSATALVLSTGQQTYFAQLAREIVAEPPPTNFDKGIDSITWLMIGFMLVMVPLVFVINGLTKHQWKEAFLFAMAVAVGLTPEMLPMIVSVCLSKGAIAMSRRQVIVKRLSSIQNIGAMDVLCTDKTGTLTLDRVILERYCDIEGNPSDEVLLDAYLISHFQAGLKSVLDRAVLEHCYRHGEWGVGLYRKLDEIPFDFSRRLMSVVVATPAGEPRFYTKGAPEELLKRCTHYELHGQTYPLDDAAMHKVRQEYEQLGGEGFRVLGVAYRTVSPQPAYEQADECDLVLRGYVAFLDPPKDSAAGAIRALMAHGISVKVLSGDDVLVCKKVCREVGLSDRAVLLGSQVQAMTDAQLAEAVEPTVLFARLAPMDKERIIHALSNRGHVVGYLGDGINDAPALHAADVGISVDTAVDIAKESAAMILLEKNLLVLDAGVLEGRKVFANILNYVRMGISSNFCNVLSVLGASAFFPFVPMAPIQVLVNNLLYDFSQVPIPTDDVDPEQIARPQAWAVPNIRRFTLLIGPISSIFDYVTFFFLLHVYHCWTADEYHTALFQTGWFVESLITQTLIIHVIRTNRIPFLQSRSSWPLMAMSVGVMAVGMWLPFSFLSRPLRLVPLPGSYWPMLGMIILAYLTLTQIAKRQLVKHKWI